MAEITSYIIVFLLLASLIALPMLFYSHPRWKRFMLRLQYSEKARMFIASLLGVVVCIFHMAYYQIHPLEKGLLVSSLYVFLAFMTKRNAKFLQFVRSSNLMLCLFAVGAIAVSFIPSFFSCAATMAFILMFACMLPEKLKERKPMTHLRAIHAADLNSEIDAEIEKAGERAGIEKQPNEPKSEANEQVIVLSSEVEIVEESEPSREKISSSSPSFNSIKVLDISVQQEPQKSKKEKAEEEDFPEEILSVLQTDWDDDSHFSNEADVENSEVGGAETTEFKRKKRKKRRRKHYKKSREEGKNID